jgi:hypothetical protein
VFTTCTDTTPLSSATVTGTSTIRVVAVFSEGVNGP